VKVERGHFIDCRLSPQAHVMIRQAGLLGSSC
jgi:hypothetical protein